MYICKTFLRNYYEDSNIIQPFKPNKKYRTEHITKVNFDKTQTIIDGFKSKSLKEAEQYDVCTLHSIYVENLKFMTYALNNLYDLFGYKYPERFI